VAESTLIDLCCHGVLDQVLADEVSPAARERMIKRYEQVFHHTILGMHEDRVDGSRGKLPRGFHVGDQGVTNCAILVRHVIENVMRIAPADVPTSVNMAAFKRHTLGGPLAMVFRGSPSAAVEAAYPGRYKPWEFNHSPQGCWQGKPGRESAIEATRWLFEVKLGWPVGEVAGRVDETVFAENGLLGMLDLVYGSSPYRAVDAAYPGRFKPWEKTSVPKGYWSGSRGRSHAVAATRWLIEERLGWTDEQVALELSRDIFVEHGLGTLIHARYHGSILAALGEAYPRRFKSSEVRRVANPMRNRPEMHERSVDSVRWLIEEALGWSHALVRACLTQLEFRAFGLHSMLKTEFGSSVFRALEQAYPDRYDADELFGYRSNGEFRESFFKKAFTELRILLDAGREDAAARKRHRMTGPRLLAMRKKFASGGVRALLPTPEKTVPPIDTQLALRALTYRQPLATAQEASRELRARGVEIGRDAVEEVWRRHGLLAVKERYRLAHEGRAYTTTAEAARALGVSSNRLQYNRRLLEAGGFAALCAPIEVDREIEASILAMIKEDASLGRVGLMEAIQKRGTPATEHAVDIVLTRFRLRTVQERVAAGGGLPPTLRELVRLEPEIRRLLRGPDASRRKKPIAPRPWWGRGSDLAAL